MANKNNKYIPPGIDPRKIQTERQTRINVMNIATQLGLKFDAENIFRRYDAILEKHQDPEERKQISAMGAAEIYKLLGFQSGLSVNGVDILPPSEEYIKVQKTEEKEKLEKQIKMQESSIIIPEIRKG